MTLAGIRRRYLSQFDTSIGLDRAEQLVGGLVEVVRRQHRVGTVAAQDGVARVGIAPELLDRLLQARLHAYHRLRREVIGDDGGALEEERQKVLDAGGGHALRDFLVDVAARGVALELLAEIAPEARLPVLVEGKLARRQEPHLVDL